MDSASDNRCFICGRTFFSGSLFLVHQIKHLKGFDCEVPTCAEPHYSQEDLARHRGFFHAVIPGAGSTEATQENFAPEWELGEAAVRSKKHFQKQTLTYKARVKKLSQYSCLAEGLKSKKSVIRIRSDDDHLCLPTSIIVAIERYKQCVTKEPNRFKRYRDCYRYSVRSASVMDLKEEAHRLLRKAGLKEAPCGIPELKKLQSVLQDYQIYVFTATAAYSLIFKGPAAKKPLYLVLDEPNSHYHVISDPTTFFGLRPRRFYVLPRGAPFWSFRSPPSSSPKVDPLPPPPKVASI